MQCVGLGFCYKTSRVLIDRGRLYTDYLCPSAQVQGAMGLGERGKKDVNVYFGVCGRLRFSVDIGSAGANVASKTLSLLYNSIAILPPKMRGCAQAETNLSSAFQGFKVR